MKIRLKDYRIAPGEEVDLKKRKTLVKAVYSSKDDYRDILANHVERLSDLQQRHYAANSYGALVIFQAMDAAGKDGAIRHVMSGVNPQGCKVSSFKHPSAIEVQHDFLWRAARELPERGQIGIFNRSYYEDVLVVRVHPEILEGQGVPEHRFRNDALWEERYRSIRDFEKHLHANGTRIVKIFLHLSKEEQRKRFLARIDEADKNWKLSPSDVVERKFWKDYRKAYESAISATSSADAPWYVVPADDKENARLIVSQIVLDLLEGLKPAFPTVTDDREKQLQAIRADLVAEED